MGGPGIIVLSSVLEPLHMNRCAMTLLTDLVGLLQKPKDRSVERTSSRHHWLTSRVKSSTCLDGEEKPARRGNVRSIIWPITPVSRWSYAALGCWAGMDSGMCGLSSCLATRTGAA